MKKSQDYRGEVEENCLLLLQHISGRYNAKDYVGVVEGMLNLCAAAPVDPGDPAFRDLMSRFSNSLVTPGAVEMRDTLRAFGVMVRQSLDAHYSGGPVPSVTIVQVTGAGKQGSFSGLEID